MCYTSIKRCGIICLILCLLLPLAAGCDGQKAGGQSNELRIAITGDSFSDLFLESFNPLYAESAEEQAASSLIAPTIMRYEEGKGWVSVLGTITSEEKDGKTVATVKLKKGLRYSSGRQVGMDDYLRTVKFILRTNYTGYYKDFYTYPIEGLVACRYNCAGLTLADLPDFDALLSERFKEVEGEDATAAKKAYMALLQETKIFGTFNGNPESFSPDGRSFKEVILQDSKTPIEEDYFSIKDGLEKTMLEDLCKIYSNKSRSEWMIKSLKNYILTELQEAFAEECMAKNQYVNGAISGMRITDNSYYATTMKVTFDRIIEDENDVIRMLNLPMMQSVSSSSDSVVGVGSYAYKSFFEGRRGKMAELESTEGGRTLYLLTMAEKDVYATLHMGQLSAAAIQGEVNEELVAKYGLSVLKVGDDAVLYLPDRISKDELALLKLLV
ncbi:MAG: hypothetical protein J6M12_01955 [Clostridia bacterium]|nr:hypothetical protein [Clostridia bacterium]